MSSVKFHSKNRSLGFKKRSFGFTLVELMVVITILWILVLLGINTNFSGISDPERRDRFAGNVVSMIRSEITKTNAGKAISDGSGSSFFPSETRITISPAVIETQYFSGTTLVGTGTVISSPFFGESRYVLRSLSGSLIDNVPFPQSPFDASGSVIISLSNGKIPALYYSGTTLPAVCTANPCPLVQLELSLGYDPSMTRLFFDSRSGVAQILK